MEAISDLDRIGCGGAYGPGIRTGAVAAPDLGAGMSLKPVGQSGGGAVGQDIDRPAGLDVDEDGAVDVTALEREVVDAEHPRASLNHRFRKGSHEIEQGVHADRALQRPGEAGPGPARQSEADCLKRLALQHAATAITEGETVDLLGEGPARASRAVAPEAADLKVDFDPSAADSLVRYSPALAVVHPRRPRTTTWASRPVSPNAGRKVH